MFYMRTTEKTGSQSAATKIKLIIDETIYDSAKPGDEHKAKAMDAVVQICEINSEKIRDYISYINISRGVQTDPAISERLKRIHFAFDNQEFSQLLQASKELHAVFYNKSIAVHLHTDGMSGHVSADLPTKTTAGIQVMPNVGLHPVHDGIGIAPTPAKFVSVPGRSADSARTVTVLIPVPQEQFETLAELTAKRMINPGVNYQITALGHNNYNCIHYMHKHLQDAGITSGLNNLFPLEQLQKHTWVPILIPHIVNYSDEFKLQQFRIGLSASDASSKNEADMIATKQRELAQQYAFAKQQQFNSAVTEFDKIRRAQEATRTAQRAAEARATIAYQAAYARTKDAAMNPAYNPIATRLAPSPPPITYPQALQRFSQSTSAAATSSSSSGSAPKTYSQTLQRSFNVAFGRDSSGYDSFGRDSFGRDRFGRDSKGLDWCGRDRFGNKPESILTRSSSSYTSCLSMSSTSYSWQSSSRSSVWDTYMKYVPAPKFSSSFERMYGISEYKFANMGYVSRLYFLRDQIDVSGLLSSYNSSVGFGAFRDSGLSQIGVSEIGGVAAEVGILEGFKNSSTHALFDTHRFVMRTRDGKMPCTDLQLQQLMRELYRATYEYETNAFFSLDFNTKKFMWPVLHPAFQNTLVGEVIGNLDFWMKGFCNGGTYSADFIRQWHKTANMDKQTLKPHLIDLKTEFARIGVKYVSLREAMAEAGLEGEDFSMDDDSTSPYKTKFRTSFRIISYVKSVQGKEGVFLFEPTFRVEHTIEPMPDYKAYLESYQAEHGSYPEDYLKLLAIYEKAKKDIAEQMPLLPMFRDYFEMLKIITQISYHFTTLKSMGMEPNLPIENLPLIETSKSFPPLPVRQYQYPRVHLSMKTVIDYLQRQVPAGQPNALDQVMTRILKTEDPESRIRIFNEIADCLKNAAQQILLPLLPAGVNESPIFQKRIAKAVGQICEVIAETIHAELDRSNANGLFIRVIYIQNAFKLTNLFDDFKAKPSIEVGVAFVQQKLNEYEAAQLRLALPTIPEQDLAEINKQIDAAKARSRTICNSNRAALNAALSDLPRQEREADSSIRSQVEHGVRAQISRERPSLTEAGINGVVSSNRSRIDAIISQEIASLRSKVEATRSEINQEISKTYSDESADMQRLDQERVRIIRDGFQQQVKHHRDSLTKSAENAKALTRVIAKRADYDTAKINNYPVSTLDFTDNNKIVGGCGVQLKKMQLTPVDANDQRFMQICDAPITGQEKFCLTRDGHYVFAVKVREQVVCLASLSELSQAYSPETHTLEEFKKILDASPELISIQDENGAIPLYYAALSGNDDVVNLLVQRGANVNHQVPSGSTPLMAALQNHHCETALLLINSPQLTVNHVLNNGENYLHKVIMHSAVTEPELKVAVALVQKGVSLLAPRNSDGLTPWHMAVMKGDIALVKAMLASSRVTINAQTTGGLTALHIAAEKGDVVMLEFLLANNANAALPDKKNRLPLELAIREYHEDMALILAEKTRDQVGKLLVLAGERKLFSVGDVLISKHNAPTQSQSDERDYVYYLLQFGEKMRVQQLIEQNKINLQKQYRGASMSRIAARHHQMPLAHYLISKRVPVSVGENTLIEAAVIADDVNFLRQFILSNDVLDPKLAYLAALNSSMRCLPLLLSVLTEAEIQSANLMDAAIRSGDQHVVVIAVEHCKDINQPINAARQTPWMLAKKLGDEKLMLYLSECGALPDTREAAAAETTQTPPRTTFPDEAEFLAIMLNPTATERFLRTQIQLDPKQSPCSLLRLGIDNHIAPVMHLFVNHAFPADAKFDHGESKLHLAVRMNNGDFAKICLEQIYVDITTDENVTPLMLAVALGNEPMVSLLLSHHANPNIRNTKQHNALHMALGAEHEIVALQLIPLMKKIDAVDCEGNTALIIAAINGLSKAMKLLLKAGAKWDARDDKGLTALHYAAIKGHKTCVELLIAHRQADINIRTSVSDPKKNIQNTPLHFAAQEGHLAICKLMLLNGADPLSENAMKITPMDMVFAGKNPDVIELFSQLPEFFNPRYQLNRLRVCMRDDNAQAMRELIAMDVDVTPVDEQGNSALHFAARDDAVMCAKILVDTGCSVDGVDNEGNTALHRACESGSVGVVNVLILACAKIDAVNHEGLTPVLIAIANNHSAVLLKLALSGADLTQVSKHGVSPAVLALSKDLCSTATMITILTQHLLSQSDFVGYHEKLFSLQALSAWMSKIQEVWNRSQAAGDNSLHLAVRLDSTDAIHVLSRTKPALFGAKNIDQKTPAQLAQELRHTQSQNALRLC